MATVPILAVLMAAPTWADGRDRNDRGDRGDRSPQRAAVRGRDGGQVRSNDRDDYDARGHTRVQVGVRIGGRHGAFDLEIGKGRVGYRPAPRVYYPPPRPVVVLPPPVYYPPPRPVIVAPPPVYCPPPPVVVQPPVCDDRGGWDLLTDGNAYAARDAFARKADDYPTAPKPRIGYAISTGMLHDYTHSVAALKDAVRIDPQALLRVPRNGFIDGRITQLITDMDRDAEHFGVPRGDVFFTQAALHLTLDNLHAANAAVEQAVRYCPGDPAVLALRDLIAARINAVGYAQR